MYRCVRDRTATNKQDGEGVLVAILHISKPSELGIALTLHSDLSHAQIEHIMVELPSTVSGKRHVINAAYIPPKTSTLVYDKHFELLQEVLVQPSVDSLSDYNLPEGNWLAYTQRCLRNGYVMSWGFFGGC